MMNVTDELFESSVRVRLLGAVAVFVAIVGLLLYPYHMHYHYEAPGVWSPHLPLVNFSMILWPVWASMIAWGLATIATAKLRSLTPGWAALDAIFVAVPAAIETFRKPMSDVVTPEIRNWEPPAGVFDLVTRVLAETYFSLLAAPLFLLLGVAWARDERGWFAGGIVGLFVYAAAYDFVTPGAPLRVLFGPFLAAIPGAILFYAGTKLAARPDNGAGMGNSPTRSSAESTTD